jgi:hypothetical protein
LEYANQTDFGSYNLPVATQPPTPTPTLTPTPAYAWDGAWNGYLDLDLGHPAPDFCSMSLTTTGNSISGTYDCGNPEGMGNLNGTISGSLSNNRQNASGTWSNSFGASGSFSWQIKSGNTNQFVGSYDNEFAWCGARASASQPSPCKWP